MVEVFIFDWSGVISDDTKPVYEANMMLLVDCGCERISFEEWRKRSALSPAGFLKNCGLVVDEAQTYVQYKIYFNGLIGNGMHPEMIAGANKTLEHLATQGKKLMVLSAHPQDNLVGEINSYGMEGIFSHVAGNTLDKVIGLRGLKERFGFEGNALYLGDTIHDIRAAHQAQIKSCAVTTGYHSRERLEAENPDFIIEDLSWLKGMF